MDTWINSDPIYSLVEPKDCKQYELICLSLKADSLRNKKELKVLMYLHDIDIIAILEVKLKSYETIQQIIWYWWLCYLCQSCNLGKRWTTLWKGRVKPNPPRARQLQQSVWCEVRLKGNDKLIIGSVYRSPNSSQINTNEGGAGVRPWSWLIW